MSRKRKAPNGDSLAIARMVHAFLDDYAPRHLTGSEHTLKAYRDALTLYFEFLQARGVTPDTLGRSHLERAWIEGWMEWLADERGNAPQTVNNRLASVRRFLEYAASRDAGMAYLYVEAKQIARLTAPKRHVEGLSRAAVEALLAAPDASTAIGRRDLTFMVTMYGTGARMDEVRSLRWGQLHLDAPRPYVTYHGKGNKNRSVFLLPRATLMLRRYASEALGPDPGADDLLFPSRVRGGPMSEAAWDKRIKKYAAMAHESCPEVPVDAHAHLLRHSAATAWLADGMNVAEVQRLLGHEDISTTMVYIDLDTTTLQSGMEKLETDEERAKEKKWHDPGARTLLDHVGLGRDR